ncbi:flagellar motor switch protein FliG [Ferrovum myxofaciens]|jgi:flagellar motor switch protein FliG|uniref:Flagellar motor switch protein FliG n=1 Tax=Ferrovum myxofaciens TaxID=416213 RepID=A0A9E6SWN5_9PROT|nr:flagellar motor switch protein FliG [Ferrovum myxofaciens]MBU6994713.1 flagellar motor switch protein FliG [Ferrovum myxofaciens]QKE38561.1 MAG: flagellar motor switch protein FliG [Ferrovum myxofaciens]QWY73754.1 MAG: flagellar motor switch protein FliG [Ferrovum myxofaciens]QWY76508.1 MAG: flagellar motor switch protein FliG [Ferrovum myxofaciens]
MSDEGVDKCAVFLMALGENEAAEVLKQLSPKEVQKISTAMASMKSLTKEQISTVFDEFHQLAGEKTSVGSNSSDYIKKMLNQALGDDKAAGLIERILHGGDTSGIESLKWMDAVSIAELISNEHPQIIATILAHLEPDQCAGVLNALTERTRNDVILRIATLDGVQPLALRELNDVLTKLLMGSATTKKRIKGGTKATAEILNYVGGTTEASVIEAMRAYDPDLAQKILDEMFVFDNVMEIDDRGIQLILREIQSESLIVALKGASPELREKIFKNMSQRAAEMMREDLDAKGPVRVSDVEAEQKEIIKTIRRMADEGQIALGGKGDDAFV